MPGETEKNRLYTSGQMAELNGVSRKTLRLYQQKGVLEPKYVDESSGYRYYTIEQIAQLDLIQKLQAVGLTLQQIGELLKQKDVGALEQCMREQAASLDAQIEQLRLARDTALRLEESCNVVQCKPPCNQLTVEWMPRKRLLRFDIDKYDYNDFENWQSDGSYHWEMALRSVKKRIGELGLPMALFHNVGCLAEKASLEQGRFVISGACVHIDDSFSHDGCQYHILPAGLYITAYCDGSRDTPAFRRRRRWCAGCSKRFAAAAGKSQAIITATSWRIRPPFSIRGAKTSCALRSRSASRGAATVEKQNNAVDFDMFPRSAFRYNASIDYHQKGEFFYVETLGSLPDGGADGRFALLLRRSGKPGRADGRRIRRNRRWQNGRNRLRSDG